MQRCSASKVITNWYHRDFRVDALSTFNFAARYPDVLRSSAIFRIDFSRREFTPFVRNDGLIFLVRSIRVHGQNDERVSGREAVIKSRWNLNPTTGIIESRRGPIFAKYLADGFRGGKRGIARRRVDGIGLDASAGRF